MLAPISGLIFGRPNTPGGPDARAGVLRYRAGLDLPIRMDVDLGHTPAKPTLPAGCVAERDAARGRLTLLEGGVAWRRAGGGRPSRRGRLTPPGARGSGA